MNLPAGKNTLKSTNYWIGSTALTILTARISLWYYYITSTPKAYFRRGQEDYREEPRRGNPDAHLLGRLLGWEGGVMALYLYI